MFPQQPIPTAADPDTQYLHSNSTITSSGSQVFAGFGTKEISIVVNVTSSPTGTSPTLTVTLQEVDPGDLTAVFGTVASTGTINAIGVYTASLVATTGGTVKVSWTIGGTSSPTFTGVYSTVTSKLGINSTVTGSASVTAAQGTAATLSGAWPVKVTDGTNTLPTGDAVGRAIFEKITDGTNTAAVKAASTAAIATDPALVVAVSPNNSVAVTAASLPLPSGAATSANQTTLGNQTTKINDGTNTATIKPASTAAVATDTAIVVAISPNNSITASNPSVGSNNAAIPTSSTQVGGSDGTNLQAARVFDADTGGGTQYVLGAVLRKSASGGSVEAGTSSDPLRVDPTGTTTQPVSGTVTANIGTSGSLALDSTLTGGTQQTKITDGTNVASVKAASTAAVATDKAVVVAVSPNNAVAVTQSTAAALAGAWPVKVTDGTNSMPTGDAVGRAVFHKVTDGTNTAAVKAASTAAVATDPAVVVAVSPNNTVTISGTVTANVGTSGSLALDATLTGGTQKAIARGGAKGSTVAADVTSTASGSNHQPIDVAIYDASGNQITTFGGGTQFADGAARGTATGTLMMVDDGTLIQSASGDSTGKLNTNSRVTDGTNTAAVKAASTAAVATDPALVVAISPNNPISVSGTADATATGALGALNAAVQVTTAGLASVGFQLAAGTLIGTIIPEVSFDGGTTWIATYLSDPATGIKASSVVFGSSNTATAREIVGVDGTGLTRIRVSAYTSGTANITLRASLINGTTLERVSSSGASYTTLTSPTALALGMYSQVTSYGTLKVTTEGSELFVEPFDGTVIDTVNRWNQTLVGTAAMSQANGSLTITTGTTASNAAALVSQNLFRAVGLGFQIFGASLGLEAVALTNNHRFWGLGTPPGSWAASTPVQDGAGFEQDTTGALNAVTYSNGTRTIAAVLSRPSDGLNHRYAMYVRADLVFWYLDTLEYPIASASWPPLGQQTLPIRFHSINHTSGPSSGPTFNILGIGMTETSHSGVQISDGVYAWRKATVKPSYQAVAPADPALAVSVSPNSLISNYNGTVVSFDTGNGASGVPNPWYWQTMLSGTMDIISTVGGLTINSVSALTTNGSYGGVLTNRYLPLDSPTCTTFVVRAKTASANSFISFGLGSPTFIIPTTLSGTGAYFVVNGATNTLSYRLVGPLSATVTTGVLVTQLTDTAYYTCRIFLGGRNQVRFVVELGTTLINDVTVAISSADPFVAGGSSMTSLQAFLHVFNNAAVGTAPVVRMPFHYMVNNDSDRGKTMAEQRAGSGMSAPLVPFSATNNSNIAEAAPTGGTPDNLGVRYNTLGGEFLLNTTASSENIRGVFGYQVPYGVTLIVTDITIPQYAVSTTLGATVNIHDWFVQWNAVTNTYNSANTRLALGTFTAASAATAGTIFNGQPLVHKFTTPLVVQSGKYIVISVKYRSANATGAIRGGCLINGYYE